jgi:predicted TIM-barrel fold metal-dependent hydrolase
MSKIVSDASLNIEKEPPDSSGKITAKKVIYNCHAHLFTHENIPDRYFPFRIIRVARVDFLRSLLSMVMKVAIPWAKNDRMQRCANFVNLTYRKTQEKNLNHLMGFYPEGTRFVILPMDMDYMEAGEAKKGIDEQHEELAKLYKKYSDILIPFAHIDPRRSDALPRLKYLVEEHEFKGVKIYPTLGYYPDNPILMNDIYPYMVKKNIPLMAHCSPGSVNNKGVSRDKAHMFADPYHYRCVMRAYPDLRVCLSHFGGVDEWRKFIDEPRNSHDPTWLEKIRDMMKSGKFPNLYADISYTVFNFQENITLLKVLLEDEMISSKVLFGSDFYMVANEKYPEKRLSIDLRAALGENSFWNIANRNPRVFLNMD